MSFKPSTRPVLNAACAGIVPHRAFREARAEILEAAGRGPATLAVLGEAGTGKTWLLRHLGIKLRAYGHTVMLLRQGDLPYQLVAGTVLLIDEASRLDPQALAVLAGQDQTFVILADLPKFGEVLEQLVPPIGIVRLPPLEPDEVPGYVAAWLQLSGRSAQAVSPDGIDRLALHSDGTPRLIARLLDAAFALGGQTGRVTGAEIDEVALMRLNGLDAGPVEQHFAPPTQVAIRPDVSSPPLDHEQPEVALVLPIRRRGYGLRIAAAVITATALAATVVFALRSERLRPAATAAVVPIPKLASASLVKLAGASVPAQVAVLAPEVADRIAPRRVMLVQPDLATTPAQPDPAAMPVQPGLATAPAQPELAAMLAEPDLAVTPVAPTLLALSAAPPVRPDAMAPLVQPGETPADLPFSTPQQAALADIEAAGQMRTSRPGLILLARQGDTLRTLYTDLYRGVQPPPYDDVAAANPRPVRPGSVVVFPAPLGGWSRP